MIEIVGEIILCFKKFSIFKCSRYNIGHDVIVAADAHGRYVRSFPDMYSEPQETQKASGDERSA